jgi:hypothetical protein
VNASVFKFSRDLFSILVEQGKEKEERCASPHTHTPNRRWEQEAPWTESFILRPYLPKGQWWEAKASFSFFFFKASFPYSAVFIS